MKNNIFFESKKRCKLFRKRILDLSQKVSALHIGGSFSCTEIMDLIFNILSTKKEKSLFVLSKGHASILQYVILEYLGIIKKKDVENYCTKNGFLGVHPDIGNPGINASTGSLGHGLGMVAGIAIAENKTKNNIYSILSDGELQEGSVWEIILQAPAMQLNNLVGIVDYNNLQSMDFTTNSHPNFYPIVEKLVAFGWEALEVDAHDQEAIYNAILTRSREKPFLLVCKSIKGKGVSFMENQPMWHYRSPNKEEFQMAMHELAD